MRKSTGVRRRCVRRPGTLAPTTRKPTITWENSTLARQRRLQPVNGARFRGHSGGFLADGFFSNLQGPADSFPCNGQGYCPIRGVILEPGDEAAGFKRAVSWETLLTCCFTPHRLSSLLERAGSSQTQGLPATSKQTAAKRKRVTLPRMPLATTRKQPYAPANVHAPDSHHATVKPSRQERTRRRECEHQAETLHRSKQRAAPKDGSLQSSYGPAYAFDAW